MMVDSELLCYFMLGHIEYEMIFVPKSGLIL